MMTTSVPTIITAGLTGSLPGASDYRSTSGVWSQQQASIGRVLLSDGSSSAASGTYSQYLTGKGKQASLERGCDFSFDSQHNLLLWHKPLIEVLCALLIYACMLRCITYHNHVRKSASGQPAGTTHGSSDLHCHGCVWAALSGSPHAPMRWLLSVSQLVGHS